MESIRGRDNRRPGWCWQENELYDVFQPIVGPHAVSVYVNLTRVCRGQSRVACSVRDLSKATGLSSTAVWRNLAVLAHVGMLRINKGRGSAGSSCDLCDLKDAAEALGASYQARRASYVLPDDKILELRGQIAVLRQAMQCKTKPAGEPVCVSPVCVSQGNTNDGADLAASEVESNACVSPRNACVSLDGVPLIEKNEEAKNPPQPLPSGGAEQNLFAAQRRAAAIDAFAWGRFRLALKQYLCDAMPLGKQKHMPKIVGGQEDFDSCFRDWWLRSAGQRDGIAAPVLLTDAADPDATRCGLAKYRKRVEELMVRHFGAVVEIQVLAV